MAARNTNSLTTSSDARIVKNEETENTKIWNEPYYAKKRPPETLSELDDSKTPLKVVVELGEKFFSNPELGADVDSESLDQLFTQLGFQVIRYDNLRRIEIMRTLIDFSDTVGDKDNPCDMLIVCVLSHGKANGKIVSSDSYDIDIEQDILRRFNNEYCPQLQDVSWEDMLIAYSTLPGYVSNRDHFRGTWFVESICKAFMTHAKDTDLRDLLDEAAWILKGYTSEGGTKQSLGYEVRHFYKKLYFNPGHFVAPKEKWKHTNSVDFDTLLLEKSLEKAELLKVGVPGGRRRTLSHRVTSDSNIN